MRKAILFFFICFNIYAQQPTLDHTFNSSNNESFQQNIGMVYFMYADGTFITTCYDRSTNSFFIKKLNTDGSFNTSFNNIDTNWQEPIEVFLLANNNFICLSGTGPEFILKTYNSNGILISSITTTLDLYKLRDVEIQNDGKLLLANVITANNNIAIIRLNTDGSIDTTFNTGNGFPESEYSGILNTVAVQTDGKILVGGHFENFNGVAKRNIIRLNTNGTLDTTFAVPQSGGNGFDDNTIEKIAIQSDGKIMCGGSSFRNNGAIVSKGITRLLSNGSRDTGFNYTEIASNTEIYYSDFCISSNGKYYLRRSDGKILRLNSNGSKDLSFNDVNIAGDITEGGIFHPNVFSFNGRAIGNLLYKSPVGNSRYGLHKLNLDGSLDTTFNPQTGINFHSYGENINDGRYAYSKVLLDGKILLFGSISSYNESGFKNNICRLTHDGQFDSSFVLDPLIKIESIFSFNYTVNGINSPIIVKQQNDGKIVIAGNGVYKFKVNGIVKSIIRINENGSLDTTFSSPFMDDDSSFAICNFNLQTDGKIILTKSDSPFKLTRLNQNGSIDTSFNSMIFYSIINKIYIQPDNKIIVCGIRSSNSSTPVLTRLNPNGDFDPTFSTYYSDRNFLKIQSDGKFLTSDNNGVLARLNADGTTDDSFLRTNGIYVSNAQTVANGTVIAQIYQAGNPNKFAVFNQNGTLISTFGNLSFFDSSYRELLTFTLQDCDKLLIIGDFSKVDGLNKNYIARYNLASIMSPGPPSGLINQNFTQGQTLSNFTISGQNIQWYRNQNDCMASQLNRSDLEVNSLLPISTPLVDGVTYYASQTVNGIESNHRLPITAHQTLGINENTITDLKLYPNPIQNNLTVTNSANIDKIEIYNLVGSKIFEKDFNSTKIEIDFSNYGGGIYLIKVHSENKVQTNKMIKK